jgi:molybdopterin-containing oxidoreductase family iron-sulfur binding subunit
MKRKIDPELFRDRLSVAQGKRYWRSLEELANDPAFEEMLQREFPAGASLWGDLSRRRFLALMGASLALSGVVGCGFTKPRELIMPYVRQPENIVLGKPLFYATTMPLAGTGVGVLVESHEGRPTKIEGNPQHPSSLGGTDAFGQAAILGLYDPDRARTVTYRGQGRTLDGVLEELRGRLNGGTAKEPGKGVAILTEAVGSPTLAWQLGLFKKSWPQARLYHYEPTAPDNAHRGAHAALGANRHLHYRVRQADVILTIGGDFLASGPGHLAYLKELASRRRQGGKAPENVKDFGGRMNRLYAVESSLTSTGAVADHRLAVRPSQVDNLVRALAVKVGVEGIDEYTLLADQDRWTSAVVRDLRGAARGATLVVAGPEQSPTVHALVLATNARLGNLGKTVVVSEAPRDPAVPFAAAATEMASLRALYDEIQAGRVKTLLVLGGNPAYTAPADVPFAALLEEKLRDDRDWLALHLGHYRDETSRLCHWHVAESHFLESWGDTRGHDGTASLIQPLIAPLYATISAHDLLAALTRLPGSEDYDTRTGYEVVRDYWREHRPDTKKDFERFWREALHDGLIRGSAPPAVAKPTLADGWARAVGPAPKVSAGPFELVFAPDPTVFDGRFANNGWLQELDKPVTKLTWDNAALMSPETAHKLRVGFTIPTRRGGEHGNVLADVVKLKVAGRELEVAAWIVPGHPEDTITLHLGYGRTHAGKVGTGAGVDANRLRTTAAPWVAPEAEVSRAGRKYRLACTQAHFNMAARDPVQSFTLEETRAKGFHTQFERKAGPQGHHVPGGHEEGQKRHELPTLYESPYKYTGYKWGMAIDLSACVGCGACVVACQSENNIPVVGKEQVTKGREMHWLRIDRYFETPLRDGQEIKDELRVHFQPLMCVHCEYAPCEVVCPVEATVHGDEGTNDMVYNRCVGTKYCANNCPYKVRRFNFHFYSDYETPSLRLMYNPEVTVRSRGVMEKCTFCIQRIAHGRIEAAREALNELGLPEGQRKRRDHNGPDGGPRRDQGKEIPAIFDGEVVSACQAACPAGAIVFGDINGPGRDGRGHSHVHELHESPLRYDLLGELGTRPRVAYLAAVRNPNPELEHRP